MREKILIKGKVYDCIRFEHTIDHSHYFIYDVQARKIVYSKKRENDNRTDDWNETSDYAKKLNDDHWEYMFQIYMYMTMSKYAI